MMYPYFDSTMILLIPALILSMWAQFKVKSTFAKYSEVRARRGVTAASVARALLDRFGLTNVPIQRIGGQLTDHYDPRDKTLHLSDSVSGNSSIAAIGVAAHEVGRRKVVVAAHGDERAAQARCHVLDEAGLAAARGSLDEHRQALRERMREECGLAALLGVVGHLFQVLLFAVVHGHGLGG